jgi:error-prone DNA polymerase
MSRERFDSLDDLIAQSDICREELATLAEVGALSSFGYDRRAALWQIEKAVRKKGMLFEKVEDVDRVPESPLPKMTQNERVVADYEGTGLTIGAHPMSLQRRDLAMRGVLRAVDLSQGQHGRRVRFAGSVITRQRPTTAKGFVFLTLEDETGLGNIIVRPRVFADQKALILEQSFLLVEGRLQIQDGVTSVKADRFQKLWNASPATESHDFY